MKGRGFYVAKMDNSSGMGESNIRKHSEKLNTRRERRKLQSTLTVRKMTMEEMKERGINPAKIEARQKQWRELPEAQRDRIRLAKKSESKRYFNNTNGNFV